MSETWALVPLKRLDRAKRRLSPALETVARRDLVLAMARDVGMAIAGAESVARTVLVTSEPEAGYLLRSEGLEVFYSSPREGLNRELEQAAEYAGTQGADRVLIVHGDLPFLTTAALERFLAHADGAQLCAAPCKKGTGTNLLLAPLPLPIPLLFGDDSNSLKKFRSAARDRGLKLTTVRDPELAMDIDSPDDFKHLAVGRPRRPSPGPATRSFLSRHFLSSPEEQNHV